MTYGTAARFTMAFILLASSTGAVADPDPGVLKSLADGAGKRVYVLVRDGVEVRDAGSWRKVAFVTLADWVWVGEKYSCPPDIAFAPEGDILVTSNVIPAVWRIDRRTLATTVHKPVLEQDQGRDTGFIGMRWSRNLRAYAAVSGSGATWHVDSSLSRGRRMAGAPAGPLARPCEG
jgi:hypothetical protein